MLREAVDDMKIQQRKMRADALRATRKIDKPLARFMLRHWRNADTMSDVALDAMIYGSGWYKIERVRVEGHGSHSSK